MQKQKQENAAKAAFESKSQSGFISLRR